MEYKYITFKPEGKEELKMGIREFQDLHPEINFRAFFSRYHRMSSLLKNNVKVEKIFLDLLTIPDGIPIEICTLLREYIDYRKSNIKISVTLKNIVNALLYKDQEINLVVNEEEVKKSHLPYIISAYKVNTVNGINPNEFLQRRKIYLEAIEKIGNNNQIDFKELFKIALNYNLDSNSLAKLAKEASKNKNRFIQISLEELVPQNKRISKQFEDKEILLQSYFEKFTKEEIELITSIPILPYRENIIIGFEDIPDDKLEKVINCLKGKENVALMISTKDKQKIIDQNISFKGINANFACNLVSEATEDFISRFDTGEIAISPNENTATIVDINKYKILLRKLRKIVKGISLDEPEEVRFKKVYTRLAKKLEYDHEMVEDSEELIKYQEANAENSRNLVNSLLLGKCVCAGMAETLKQALSLVNISCINCRSKTIIKNERQKAHKYSLIKINGQWYNADLTWDRKSIRNGEYPEFCLKSDEEFTNVEGENKPFHMREDEIKIKCEHSLELFKKEKYKEKIKEKLQSIRALLTKANILKGKKSNTLLLPEQNLQPKNNLWRQSIKANLTPTLNEQTEEAETKLKNIEHDEK